MIALTFVPIGTAPGRDREVDYNNDALEGLPEPFEAEFFGGRGDDDGTLWWSLPIEVAHRQEDDSIVTLRFAPADVPLEVGHVEPETASWHILRHGGVARWPYGHEHIVVMLRTGAWGRHGLVLDSEVTDGALIANRLQWPAPASPDDDDYGQLRPPRLRAR